MSDKDWFELCEKCHKLEEENKELLKDKKRLEFLLFYGTWGLTQTYDSSAGAYCYTRENIDDKIAFVDVCAVKYGKNLAPPAAKT